jgi:peptidoglycan DL-endopeptidase LytF
MRFPRLTGLAIASLIVFAVLLGACTRAASTPVPTTPKGQTPAAMTGQQATMEAVRSALLTQTAQAAAGSGAASPTPLVLVTQGTPSAPLGTPGTGTPQVTTVTTAAAPTTCGQTSYTVLQGEWVYSIARKFGVDPQAIIDQNGLVAPYALTPGQSLKIPGNCPGGTTPVVVATVTPGGPTVTPGGTVSGTVYYVQAGEWVYSIARKFGVDPQAIIDANNLVAPYTLSVGQKLIIPAP